MIGVQQLQGYFQIPERGITGALLRLAGDEDLIAMPFQALAKILFAPAVRPAVDRRVSK